MIADTPYADAVPGGESETAYQGLRASPAHLGGYTIVRECECGRELRHYPVRLSDGTLWLTRCCGRRW